MESASVRQATRTAHDVLPQCPECGTQMVVRSQWTGGRVTGLYWGCRRAPGCEGVRRIRTPEQIRSATYDASAQAIFEWESSRDGFLSRRQPAVAAPPAPPAKGGLRSLMSRVRATPAAAEETDWTPDNASVGHFDALVDYGFIVLEDRAVPLARARIDNLIIGPSGVFVVERKAWAGQVVTTTDSVFVDGRSRIGAIDEVEHATTAFERTLDFELKPLGVSVRPALLFENATNKHFESTIGKVVVGGSRGLPKVIRGRGDPVLGPETIVRLAVAADRLLE